MAVLPTPGSPINIGLFLVRLCSTCIVRLISSSLPITGSSLPCSARSVRSMVYFSRAWRFSSALGSSIFCPSRISLMAFSILCLFAPQDCINLPSSPLSSIAARANNSLEIYWSFLCWAYLSVRFNKRSRSLEI